VVGGGAGVCLGTLRHQVLVHVTKAMRDRARLQIDYLCGYEWECISQWAATATAKLQVQHLGNKSVAHHITVKDPPQCQPTPRTQLELP